MIKCRQGQLRGAVALVLRHPVHRLPLALVAFWRVRDVARIDAPEDVAAQ